MDIIYREACLIYFNQVLVFVLCIKKGDFFNLLSTHFSTFHKIKTRC